MKIWMKSLIKRKNAKNTPEQLTPVPVLKNPQHRKDTQALFDVAAQVAEMSKGKKIV